MTHIFHPTILRGNDIRGIYGETLHDQDAFYLGRAFGTIACSKGLSKIMVGYDGRLSSPSLANALIEGLTKSGCHVLNMELGPTPMLYYGVSALSTDAAGIDGGIMVTGSHNPPDYNGFKMMMGGGGFYGDDIQKLGELAQKGEFSDGHGTHDAVDIMDDYVAHLSSAFTAKDGFTVTWDAGNGATGQVLEKLLAHLPGVHHGLYTEIDGTFPHHHPDPTVPENLIDLQKNVAQNGSKLGIGFDGDGDRLGVIDETGEPLWADQYMILFAREVLENHPGATIIGDVKCSETLFDAIRNDGGTPCMWKTGHAFIKSKMRELNAPLAGEMSGHIFFNDHKKLGYDDGLYAAVRLYNILAHEQKSLAEIRQSFPKVINTPELRFQCDEDLKFKVIERVTQNLSNNPNVNTTDGVRVKTPDGWWLLRASNTQDCLIARCEAGDDAGLDSLKQTLNQTLEQAGLSCPTI